MGSGLLTIQDVAEELRLGHRTVYAMASGGELPAFKVRGQWRIRRVDFEKWLGKQATREGSPPVPGEVKKKVDNKTGGTRPKKARPGAKQMGDSGGDRAGAAMGHLTKRLPQAAMHERVVDALGPGRVLGHGSFEQKPFELDLASPLPQRVRMYLFNATRPPGGRPLGEHKVQLIVPGQSRGVRGNFDRSDGRIALFAGYSAEEDVFVLWDAGLYSDFAWSRNVQVKVETIIRASAGKIATQERRLRPRNAPAVTEILVAARADRLEAAILKRIELTRERMLKE